MSGLFFTPRHEWVRIKDGTAVVGLTGVGMKGDVVYIELPDIGRFVAKSEGCAMVETVKTVFEVQSPLAGRVTAVNDTVFDDPDMISRSPMEVWLFRLDVGEADPEGLLTESEYNQLRA